MLIMGLLTSNTGIGYCPFFILFHFILFFCTLQTDKTGCVTFTFKLSTFTKLDKKVMQDKLVLKASMEEEGTGKSHNILILKKELDYEFNLNNMTHIHSCNKESFLTGISFNTENKVEISYVVGKLSFEDTPSVYEKGENVTGKVSDFTSSA